MLLSSNIKLGVTPCYSLVISSLGVLSFEVELTQTPQDCQLVASRPTFQVDEQHLAPILGLCILSPYFLRILPILQNINAYFVYSYSFAYLFAYSAYYPHFFAYVAFSEYFLRLFIHILLRILHILHISLHFYLHLVFFLTP